MFIIHLEWAPLHIRDSFKQELFTEVTSLGPVIVSGLGKPETCHIYDRSSQVYVASDPIRHKQICKSKKKEKTL